MDENNINLDQRYTDAVKILYLDDIVSHLTSLKVNNMSLDGKALLGAYIKKGAEMFSLQDFSTEVQTDILLNLAYYRSDAFKDRLAASFGYEKGETFTPEDRDLYDRVVSRAEEAYKNISFKATDNPIEMRMQILDNGQCVAYITDGQTPISDSLESALKSLNIISHEIAHYIYNEEDNGISPGTNSEYGNEYGKTDSPLNRIADSPIKHDRFLDIYKDIWNSEEFQEAVDRKYEDLSEEDKQSARAFLLKAQETSKDLLLKDVQFMEKATEHDNLGFERAADIHAADILMLRDGIWNPFGKEPLTSEQMKLFEERHPGGRIFEYWNAEEATHFLNTIAKNQLEQGNPMPSLEEKISGAYRNLSEIMKSFGMANECDKEIARIQERQQKDLLTGQRNVADKAKALVDANTEALMTEQEQSQHIGRTFHV